MFKVFSVEDLKVAQKYPFSKDAKLVVKQSGLSLDNVSEQVVERAKAMIRSSLEGHEYSPSISFSRGMLEEEILAFPVAKVILSFVKDRSFAQKFSSMFAKKVFAELEREKDDTLFSLAESLGLKYRFPQDESFFVQVKVPDFLSANFRQDFMKLVNQRVFGGNVFLSRNEFCRLLAFFFESRLLEELPVDTKGVPKRFASVALEVSADFFELRAKKFENTSFGPIKPEFFPPCLEKLYLDILGGRNLAHSERFVLATCMLSLGMGTDKVVDLYRSTPNFDEKVTFYQVSRLAGGAGKKIQAPSCQKMAEYGLRLPSCPCNESARIKHPLQFYTQRAFSKSASKPKQS